MILPALCACCASAAFEVTRVLTSGQERRAWRELRAQSLQSSLV